MLFFLTLRVFSTPILLDDFSSQEKIAAGKYTYYPYLNTPVNSIEVVDGKLRIMPGINYGAAAHMWNNGERLNHVGDKVSIQIIKLGGGSSCGLYLDSDQAGPLGFGDIRLDRLPAYPYFRGPWGMTPLSANPSNEIVNLEIKLIAFSANTKQLRATLSGIGFSTLAKDFEIQASEIYFGPCAYNRTIQNYAEFDNLIFTPSTYSSWAKIMGLSTGINDGMNSDPNNDGFPNAVHFAFNTNPLGTPTNNKSAIVSNISGNDYLTVTLPIRKGVYFSGAGPLSSASADGFFYKLEASHDMTSGWGSRIVEVIPALIAGLSPLADCDGDGLADWEYRTFRLDQTTSSQKNGFIRASITILE